MSAGEWTVEHLVDGDAFLLNPYRLRVARMTKARASGIAAALNTKEGRAAFEAHRNSLPPSSCPVCGDCWPCGDHPNGGMA